MKLGRETEIGALPGFSAAERRVVRQRRIAADAVEVLDAPFRGQPVVVPPHRVEHRLAAHALERATTSVCVNEKTCPTCSEPLTVGGGVSIEKTSWRGRPGVKR
jgi:hypothetical protein